MFHLYILECGDGSYYVGHTDNLEQRMAGHEQGELSAYTARRRAMRLVYTCEFQTRQEAFERERQIKNWGRSKKEALIRGDWDALRGLARRRAPSRARGASRRARSGER